MPTPTLFEEKIKFSGPRGDAFEGDVMDSAPRQLFLVGFHFPATVYLPPLGFHVFLFCSFFSACFFANKQQCSRHLNNTKRR